MNMDDYFTQYEELQKLVVRIELLQMKILDSKKKRIKRKALERMNKLLTSLEQSLNK